MADRKDRIGQQFGEYHLLRWLGGGGFGDIYLGQHKHDQTLVAVKILQTRLTSSEDLKEFINEARTFRLKHPNIVPLLDFGIGTDDIPFLVMAYASNGTLRDRHPKGSRLFLSTVVTYVTPIADALQYAHELHIVHRDVKPENMLLGPNQEIWLSDFGIASVAHSSHSLGTAEGIGGTLPYMAPEQIAGKPRPASDQYALGVVIYEWLCGTRPFKGTAVEIAMQHTAAPPPSIREHVPTVSEDVEQAVLRAMAKDPKQRFANIQEFAHALQSAAKASSPYLASAQSPVTLYPTVSSLATTAPPQELEQQDRGRLLEVNPQNNVVLALSEKLKPTPRIEVRSDQLISFGSQPSALSLPDSSSRRISRRTILLIGAGLVGVSIVGSGAAWLASSQESPHSQITTPEPTTGPMILRTSLFTYKGHSASVTSVAWSSDGLYIASASFDGTVQVWNPVYGASSLITFTDYSQTSNAVPMWSVAWSPNSKYIAAGSANSIAQVWALHGGSPLLIYKGHSDAVNAVKWASDNRRIASGSADQSVQVWDAFHGGSPFVTGTGYSAPVTSVAWSPDGKRIVGGSRDKTVRVWDATNRGGPLLTYKGHSGAVNAVAWSPDGRYIASGSDDKTVQVWDPNNGVLLFTYKGHSDVVNPVSWSPNGKYIASGSWDDTSQVWNASTGDLLVTYKGHSGHVNAISWSPDSKYIVSGSVDKTVQIWKAF